MAAAPDTLLHSLRAALERGDDAGALACCRARLADDPNDASAFRQLAQLLAARGEQLPALRAAMRACELAPDDARCWSDLGRVHARFGEIAHAARCFAEAVDVDSRCVDAWHNLGTAWRELHRAEPAFEAFRQALLLDDRRADSWLALGSLLTETGQFDDAVECLERAAEHDPALAAARSRLGEHWSRAGKVRRAEALFRQALSLDPAQVQAWFGLGRTLEDLGDAPGALACYRNALALQPRHGPALGHALALSGHALALSGHALALSGHAPALSGDDAALRETAQALLADPAASDAARAVAGYGLAKHHDRRGEHAAAAAAGLAANAARRRQAGALDRTLLQRRVDALIGTCDADFFRRRRRFGLGSEQPVFIVGLPRSGTTLVEQILSAHPQFHGAGELPQLARLAAGCIEADDEPWQAACRLDEDTSRRVASEYLQTLHEGAPKGSARISDKSPLNIFQLAFAALLFPYARVICCLREPRDTALSIWLENFNADQRYATDFDDLACFTHEVRRLMSHWQEQLPLATLEVCYEDTVADLEAQARRLVGFLGLPWDARCLDFHRGERAVQTPSRWQVRQPLYASSVGRWKAYAPHLPALDIAFRARGL